MFQQLKLSSHLILLQKLFEWFHISCKIIFKQELENNNLWTDLPSLPVSHKYEGRNHIEGCHQEIRQRQIEEEVVGDGPHTFMSCNQRFLIGTINQPTCYDPENAGVAEDSRDQDEGEAERPEDLIIRPV